MATAQSLCIGWLDLGEEEQRRAREYLARFKPDTIEIVLSLIL